MLFGDDAAIESSSSSDDHQSDENNNSSKHFNEVVVAWTMTGISGAILLISAINLYRLYSRTTPRLRFVAKKTWSWLLVVFALLRMLDGVATLLLEDDSQDLADSVQKALNIADTLSKRYGSVFFFLCYFITILFWADLVNTLHSSWLPVNNSTTATQQTTAQQLPPVPDAMINSSNIRTTSYGSFSSLSNDDPLAATTTTRSTMTHSWLFNTLKLPLWLGGLTLLLCLVIYTVLIIVIPSYDGSDGQYTRILEVVFGCVLAVGYSVIGIGLTWYGIRVTYEASASTRTKFTWRLLFMAVACSILLLFRSVWTVVVGIQDQRRGTEQALWKPLLVLALMELTPTILMIGLMWPLPKPRKMAVFGSYHPIGSSSSSKAITTGSLFVSHSSSPSKHLSQNIQRADTAH